jgi:Type I restriction modification DNA specificity domain
MMSYYIATPEFIWAFLESESTYRQAIRLAGGSAAPHLNVGDIREFITIIPPLSLQQKFAQIVQKHEQLRTQQREAMRQAEHLFQTLLHQAFEGELGQQAVEGVEAMGQDMRYYVPYEEDALHRPVKMVAEEAAQLSLPME